MSGIKYTILVATRKRLSNITRLLKSLKQTGISKRLDTEILIVDNSSNVTVLNNICNRYNARYIKEVKIGKAIALNTGIRNAHGEYIIFTDDDVVVNDLLWLDKLISHFKTIPNLGYVSGNVVARSIKTHAQKIWEKKGGLSKGTESKHFTKRILREFKLLPWPLTKICAGANCIIPKKILMDVGGFCSFFGPGSPIGHGESLLIGYEIMKRGYDLYYDPKAIVLHDHPEDDKSIKQKLFLYGIGDTAVHLYLFIKYGDKRSLFWSIGGHQLYVMKNFIKWFFGYYALPPSYTIYSLVGSFYGPIKFIKEYYLNRGKK